MRWNDIPYEGYPFCRYVLSAYCVCDENTCAKVEDTDGTRVKRMVKELSNSEKWERSQGRRCCI